MTNGTDYRAILASDTPLIDVRASRCAGEGDRSNPRHEEFS